MGTSQVNAVGRGRHSRVRRSAFTLAELVMVIIIIGIVAALAAPRVAILHGHGEGAALLADLRILRNSIELYASEHLGNYPGLLADGAGGAARSEAAFLSQLTQFSTVQGGVSDNRSSSFHLGPYLFTGMPPLPVGPKKGGTGVLIVATDPVPTVGSSAGWIYNPDTGEIIGNVGGEVGGAEKLPPEIVERLNLDEGVGGLGVEGGGQSLGN
jgi:general secretion pathway protein G